MPIVKNRTVVFWGAGATTKLGMPTTAQQNKIFFALSRKDACCSYRDCLQDFALDVFGDCFDDVCDLLTLLDDAEAPCVGRELTGFSSQQFEIIKRHADDLGADEDTRRNRVVMMRVKYDWASAMRIIRLQKNDVEYVDGEAVPSSAFTQRIYNLLDANIAAGTGIHVFVGDEQLSSFLDVGRLKSAKAALVMFINLVMACAWAKARKNSKSLAQYRQFADWLAEIRADEAYGSGGHNPVFSTTFVSMNFEPILWWLIKNADSRYNMCPVFVGQEIAPLYLGEDVDQVDLVRPFKVSDESVSNSVLSECAARFVLERAKSLKERSPARYQTVKMYFPHGMSNFKICPCCGKTTLYQGNKLADDSVSLFPPFFFKSISWECEQVEDISGIEVNGESCKWESGELDYIQCQNCGRAIRMCDTEMVMQSGLKSLPSYLLQRIAHNVDNAVMSARHIVLMGYSLPPDDGAWVAELQSRTTRKNEGALCSIVDFVKGEPEGWFYGEEARTYCQMCPVIEKAWGIFGKANVRVNLGGIPAVFMNKKVVFEMLYPQKWKERMV